MRYERVIVRLRVVVYLQIRLRNHYGIVFNARPRNKRTDINFEMDSMLLKSPRRSESNAVPIEQSDSLNLVPSLPAKSEPIVRRFLSTRVSPLVVGSAAAAVAIATRTTRMRIASEPRCGLSGITHDWPPALCCHRRGSAGAAVMGRVRKSSFWKVCRGRLAV